MPTEVQMLATRLDGAGGTYKAGTTYVLADDLAGYFISTGVTHRTTTITEDTAIPAKLNANGKKFDLQSGKTVGAIAPKGCTSPCILAQSGVPVILSSSATAITATGAVSGATALLFVPPGVVQVFMFLAALGGVNQLYYASYSSTTAFQLYTDAAGTITPTGLTAGAYAGGTSEATLSILTIPGGSMGPRGMVSQQAMVVSSTTSGITKTTRLRFPGASNAANWSNSTSQSLTSLRASMVNAFSETGQLLSGAIDGLSGFLNQPTTDTLSDLQVTVTGQLGNASEYLIVCSHNAQIIYGA